MGDEDEDDSPPVPAVPPSDTLWLVATHATGRGSEHLWAEYANRSRPGFVMHMNGEPPPMTRRMAPSRLSTLGPAVTALGELPTVDGTVLAMLMHGLPEPPYVAGRLHSAAARNPRVDVRLMAGDTGWNPPYLMFGWPQRRANQHYRAAVEAIRNVPRLAKVHVYGCRIGQPTFISALADFASDIGKEVWAYTGYTHTWIEPSSQFLRIINVSEDASEADKEAAPDSSGVRQEGSAFRRVTLRTTLGLLPGWQMRARTSGEVDLVGNDMGPVVQTFRRGSVVPDQSVGITG